MLQNPAQSENLPAPINNETLSETLDGLSESNFTKEDVQALARHSLDFLAGLAIPDVYKYSFPDIYLKAWELLCTLILRPRDFSQVALGLPRGFAKTLVIKIFILWVILFTNRRFIIVISENIEKAQAILSDVEDMLNEYNIRVAFGDWNAGIESNTLGRKKFVYRNRPIILKAAGAMTGIRGITEKNRRPDLMIFDDIQSREESESEVLSKQLYGWMTTTAMKAKSPEGCLFLFVANMYPTKGSLLKKLKLNPNWIKFIVGGILADGSSLWEELQPINQLLREYENDKAAGSPHAFFSEVLNDENATVNDRINLAEIPPYPYDDNEINVGSFVIIDPSSDKAKSDEVSIGGVQVLDTTPVLTHLKEGRFSPGDTVREAFKMAFEIGASLIVVESNGYQYSLVYWFEQIQLQQNITGVQVIDIYSGSMSKVSRILTMFKSLVPQAMKDGYHGNTSSVRPPEIVLHPNVRAAVFDQINDFNPLRRDNTDGILDLLTYIPRIMNEYGHMIAFNSPMMAGEIGDTSVTDESHNSPF